jgi:hypothetical protein
MLEANTRTNGAGPHLGLPREVAGRKIDFRELFFACLMGIAFCSTAAVYVDTDYNVTDQAVSILAVWGSVILAALFTKTSKPNATLTSGFMANVWLILLVASLTIFPLARTTNFTSATDQFYTVGYSVAAFFTIAVFLWHAWHCGISHLMGGFVAASIFGPIGYLALAYSQGNLAELASIEKRFATQGMHPNLLGFCCTGFACISLSAFFLSRSRWRWWLLPPTAISLATIYLASSRGSIAGIFAGLLTVCLLVVLRLFRSAVAGSFEARSKLLFLFTAIIVAITIGVFALEDFLRSEVFDSIAERLAIFNQYRGLSTGLTGRWDTWQWVMSQYTAADFWLGVGPRKSIILAGDIDNGYIVLLLENGLFAGSIIIGRFFVVTAGYMWKAFKVRDEMEFRISAAMAFITISFLTNNLVARYLFGIGNPFCLFSMVIFALGPDFLKLALDHYRVGGARMLQGMRR